MRTIGLWSPWSAQRTLHPPGQQRRMNPHVARKSEFRPKARAERGGSSPPGARLSLHSRSDPPDESGGSYESECRPGGPYGAQKKPRRQSPARPADSVRATGTIQGKAASKREEVGGLGILDTVRQIIRTGGSGGSPQPQDWPPGVGTDLWGPRPWCPARVCPCTPGQARTERKNQSEMRATGFEPARVSPRDPKSRASASSATPAGTQTIIAPPRTADNRFAAELPMGRY